LTLSQISPIEPVQESNTVIESPKLEAVSKIQAGMISFKDINLNIPEDEIVVNTGVATIAISRYGFRVVLWYEFLLNHGLVNSGMLRSISQQ
jgi:hypothetical protein